MEEIHIQCPYCLQAISILLDTGIYEPATIVEDCEVLYADLLRFHI